MKQVIVAIYNGDDWYKTQPFNNRNYQYIYNGYEMMTRYCEARDVYYCRASISWIDRETGMLNKHWYHNGTEWEKVEKPLKPNVIFDKTLSNSRLDIAPTLYDFAHAGIHIFNRPAFRDLFGGKLNDLEHWGNYMPISSVVYRKERALAVADRLEKNGMVVVKEVFGSGGKNVYIGHPEEINFDKVTYPIMIQEFIESTGFPGLSSVSDLRIEFINHKMVLAYSREAKDGSLYTNTNKGAEITMIEFIDIPKQVLDLIELMQRSLKHFTFCHYSLDFFFEENNLYFLESATTPGLAVSLLPKESQHSYFDSLVSAMLAEA